MSRLVQSGEAFLLFLGEPPHASGALGSYRQPRGEAVALEGRIDELLAVDADLHRLPHPDVVERRLILDEDHSPTGCRRAGYEAGDVALDAIEDAGQRRRIDVVEGVDFPRAESGDVEGRFNDEEEVDTVEVGQRLAVFAIHVEVRIGPLLHLVVSLEAGPLERVGANDVAFGQLLRGDLWRVVQHHRVGEGGEHRVAGPAQREFDGGVVHHFHRVDGAEKGLEVALEALTLEKHGVEVELGVLGREGLSIVPNHPLPEVEDDGQSVPADGPALGQIALDLVRGQIELDERAHHRLEERVRCGDGAF